MKKIEMTEIEKAALVWAKRRKAFQGKHGLGLASAITGLRNSADKLMNLVLEANTSVWKK